MYRHLQGLLLPLGQGAQATCGGNIGGRAETDALLQYGAGVPAQPADATVFAAVAVFEVVNFLARQKGLKRLLRTGHVAVIHEIEKGAPPHILGPPA